MSEADWYPDPFGRFEYRYFDGQQWTDRVSRSGVASTDPPEPVPESPVAGHESAGAGATPAPEPVVVMAPPARGAPRTLVGVLGIIAAVLIVVGMFPAFLFDTSQLSVYSEDFGYRTAERVGYIASEVLAAGALGLFGVFALRGRVRTAAWGLLGVIAGYAGWWFQQPLAVIARGSFGDMLDAAGPGLGLQAVAVLVAGTAGVIGTVSTRGPVEVAGSDLMARTDGTASSPEVPAANALAGWSLGLGILAPLGLLLGGATVVFSAVGLVATIGALTCGYLALGRIKRSGGTQGGRSMALVGVILGWVAVALIVAAFVIVATIE